MNGLHAYLDTSERYPVVQGNLFHVSTVNCLEIYSAS